MGILPTNKQVISSVADTIGLSPNSLQLWHYLPGDGVSFHRLKVWSSRLTPAPTLQKPIANLRLFYLCFWRTSYKLEFLQLPWVPLVCSSGSQNSGKHLGLPVCYKGYRWREAQGKVWGEGHGVSRPKPGVPYSRNLWVLIYVEASWALTLWIFMEASLHKHNWLNYGDRLNFYHLSPSREMSKSPDPLFLLGLSNDQSSFCVGHQTTHHTLEIPGILGVSCQEMGWRPNTHFTLRQTQSTLAGWHDKEMPSVVAPVWEWPQHNPSTFCSLFLLSSALFCF